MPSPTLRNILQTVEHIAVSDLGMLIVGEAGTEKEWLAQRIHELSGRADKTFLSLDCSFPGNESMARTIFGYEDLTLAGVESHQGILEETTGGTLFLDNIASLPTELLRKLAGITEHKQFRRVGGSEEIMTHARFVLGTTTILHTSGEERRLENDFSRRMCPVIINLPPLRDRIEDIPYLMKKFIIESQYRPVKHPHGITAEALRAFYDYDWPGNAQELKMVIEHSLMLCSGQFIERHDLPEYLLESSKLQSVFQENRSHEKVAPAVSSISIFEE